MATKLTVSLAQTSISQDPDGNLRTARRFLQQAATKGTDLIAFPEMFMALPQKGVPLTAVAEPIDGPFMSALSALAAEYGIAIVCGIWQTVQGHAKRAANVVVALGPDGTLLAHYNKIHLFDALSIRESDLMLRGNMPPPVFTLKGMQFGLAICYDLRFPELFRNLALRGADAVIAEVLSDPLHRDRYIHRFPRLFLFKTKLLNGQLLHFHFFCCFFCFFCFHYF